MKYAFRFLAVCIGGLIVGLMTIPVFANQTPTKSSSYLSYPPPPGIGNQVFLPLIFSSLLPPEVPYLGQINNSDSDNLYTVDWNVAARANTYQLQESTDPNFGSSITEYNDTGYSWTTPAPGKTPASYYYRLKSINSSGESGWSNIQSITIYPLFVGLKVRWDGSGYIRGSEYIDVGTHDTWNVSALTDVDTIRLDWNSWYAPDPQNFGSSTGSSYFSPSTGTFKSSTIVDDPSWKWSDSWRLAYTSPQYVSGSTVLIDGQKFKVTGPIDGYTTYGKPIKYYQFVNQQKILIWDGGGDWKQYAHAGDITLQYDAGNSKLILYESILRREYYKGTITADTVQYIITLTSSTSIPGSPAFVPTTAGSIDLGQINSYNGVEINKMPVPR